MAEQVSNIEYARIAAKAKEIGASEIRLIAKQDIKVEHWVRLKCQFGCEEYKQRLTCPPHVPSIDTTKAIISEYNSILVVQSSSDQSEDGWKRINRIMLELEKWAFLEGYYKAFVFASGPCPHCSTCNLDQCVNPQQARPSMEAMGIDVYATIRQVGFELSVVTSKEEEATYFGLLLLK